MPDIYDKVRVDVDAEDRELHRWMPWLLVLLWGIWPLRGLHGVLKAVLSHEYLLSKGNRVINPKIE